MALASLLQGGQLQKTIEMPPHVREKYDIEKELASGKFGTVFRCKEKKSGEPCAVKVMLKKNNKREDVEREVVVLKRLDHPHLMKSKDFSEDNNNFILVMELLSGGELFDYCAEKEFLVEAETVHFMKQINSGLQYLHGKNICHLDLKPENIVLKDLETKQVKIIDFGTAQDLNKSRNIKAMVGTPEFIAPEVLNFEPVTVAADMWAIGVIAFCLLTGCSPFLGDDDGETLQNISTGEYEFPGADLDEGYDDISDDAKDFITQLLIMDPSNRATAADTLKHKWMQRSEKDEGSGNRINLDRLRKLRRRRKLQAAFRAVRIGMSLLRRCSAAASLASAKRSNTDSVVNKGITESQKEPPPAHNEKSIMKPVSKPAPVANAANKHPSTTTKSLNSGKNGPRRTITITTSVRSK